MPSASPQDQHDTGTLDAGSDDGTLDAGSDDGTLDAGLVQAVRDAGHDVGRCLALARELGGTFPAPGAGDTARRWTMLAAAGAIDLTAARVLEAHTDALAILHEAGTPAVGGTWGVFAAEAPGTRLELRAGTLTGTKPWCSLGDRLDFALVTAHEHGERRLVAVDLRDAAVHSDPPEQWVAHGLPEVTSVSLHFDAAPALQLVGEPGWYLRRPGFAWGGIGVAACWYGGTLALQERLRCWAGTHEGELSALHLGVVDAQVEAAGASLARAARLVDGGQAAGPAGEVLALRVRAVVAQAAERVLEQVAHALGPAALAFDGDHARRVADLGLYVRQHHAERDLAALGPASGGHSPLERLHRIGLT